MWAGRQAGRQAGGQVGRWAGRWAQVCAHKRSTEAQNKILKDQLTDMWVVKQTNHTAMTSTIKDDLCKDLEGSP